MQYILFLSANNHQKSTLLVAEFSSSNSREYSLLELLQFRGDSGSAGLYRTDPGVVHQAQVLGCAKASHLIGLHVRPTQKKTQGKT